MCAVEAPLQDSKSTVPTLHTLRTFFTERLVILVRGRSTEYKPCGVQFLHACCEKLKGTYLMLNKKKNEVYGATPSGR